MALVNGIERKTVSFDIDKKQALAALAQELKIYKYFRICHGQYYKVKDNKIYSYEDVSYHGSPSYEERLDSDNELLVSNYELICKLSKINDIDLKWY